MKKAVASILIICLFFCLCACASSDTKAEDSLTGEWVWRAYPENPIYMFLRFEDKNVRYGTNLFGEEMESATWDCAYTIDDTKLKLVTDDGTVFEFNIQKNGDRIRIFNQEGQEFIRNN